MAKNDEKMPTTGTVSVGSKGGTNLVVLAVCLFGVAYFTVTFLFNHFFHHEQVEDTSSDDGSN